jgi:hypothetical protein
MDEIRSCEKLTDDWVTMYRLHRDRVTQEDTLINHRMSWMLWSQAILLGLWGGLYFTVENPTKTDAAPSVLLKIVEVVLCIAGILTAIGSFCSVDAAVREIERIKQLYERAKITFSYKAGPEDEIFGMVVGKRTVSYTWAYRDKV